MRSQLQTAKARKARTEEADENSLGIEILRQRLGLPPDTLHCTTLAFARLRLLFLSWRALAARQASARARADLQSQRLRALENALHKFVLEPVPNDGFNHGVAVRADVTPHKVTRALSTLHSISGQHLNPASIASDLSAFKHRAERAEKKAAESAAREEELARQNHALKQILRCVRHCPHVPHLVHHPLTFALLHAAGKRPTCRAWTPSIMLETLSRTASSTTRPDTPP